jgi:type 1 glutamine amidotransferase
MGIWRQCVVAAAAAAALAACAAPAAGPGARPGGGVALLNGRNLDGWRQVGAGRFTTEPDGAIVSEGGPGLLYNTRRFGDFILELDWKADTKEADSGIFLRLPQIPADLTGVAAQGYEVQIADDYKAPARPVAGAPAAPPSGVQPDAPLVDGRDKFIRMSGAIYDASSQLHLASRPTGEWNHFRIEASGQRYQVYLNGEKVNDYVGNRSREGYIALESRANSRVHFRGVRITPFTASVTPQGVADVAPKIASAAPLRVLVVTATQGFRHTESIDASKLALKELERTTELRFDISDDASVINADNLRNYDVLFLNNATLRALPATTGDTAELRRRHIGQAGGITVAQQDALRDFVRSGKGLATVHSGVDALYGDADFREMVGGGLFTAHPWTQPGRMTVEDRTSAATSQMGDSFWWRDEMYTLDKDPRHNVHVLFSLDVPTVGVPAGAQDHPMAFLKQYGQGRVFVTVLGHFGDSWRRPEFISHVVQGLRIAGGRLPADFTPS